MAVVTQTLKDDGSGDYSLLQTWEAQQLDLVALGDSYVLDCYAPTQNTFHQSTAIIIDWNTDAANFITIRAVAGAELNGDVNAFLNETAGVIFRQGNATHTIRLAAPYTVLQDVGIKSLRTSNLTSALQINAGGCLVERCIAHPGNSGIGSVAFSFGFNNTSVLQNCIAVPYPSATNGTGFNLIGNSKAYNCHAIDMPGAGFNGGSVPYYVNCVAFNCGTGFDSALTSANNKHNASDDASAPGSNSVTGITSAAFVDYAGGDYNPSNTGALFDAGTNVSLTDDIRGISLTDSASVTHYPIGAYRGRVDITHTLRSSAGDYTLMSTWESTELRDLVVLDETETLECYADWPSGLDDPTTVAGWTTGASNTLTIKAAAGAEHNGVPGAGFWIKRTTGGGDTLTIDAVDYLTVQGIEVTFENSATTNNSALAWSGCDYLLIDSVIVTSDAGSSGSRGIDQLDNTAVTGVVVRNCLVYGCTGTGIFSHNNATASYYNNTTVGNGLNGFFRTSTGGSITAINNVAYGNGTADFDGPFATFTHNASSDTTAGSNDTGSSTCVDNITSADFVDYAGGDYTPAAGGALAGAGTDLSAYFDDDITGATR